MASRHYAQGVTVGVSTTHHRRQSTKSAMASGPGSAPYDELLPPANADYLPSSPSKDKLRAGGLFAFPAPTPSNHGPDSNPHVGYTSARIPSGGHAPNGALDAIYEAPNGESHRVEYASKASSSPRGGATYGPVDSADMSPSRTRHRVSPSLPYAPMQSSEMAAVRRDGGRSTAASTVSGNLSQIGRVVYSNVRRGRPIDVIGLVVFAFAVLVFLSALFGMGYVDADGPMATPPPIARPRHNTQPLAGAKAPLAAADPRRELRVPPPAQAVNIRAPPKAPLIIKEDEALLAEEEASRPDWAKPQAAGGDVPIAIRPFEDEPAPAVGRVGVPMAQRAPDEAPVRVAALGGKRPRVVPVAADDDAIAPPRPAPKGAVPEPDDHREFVRDSPDDAALDDEHAAHYHHAPDSNIFRGQRKGADLDDHAHAHAHGRHAEAVDIAQRTASDDLDAVDASVAAAGTEDAGDEATDGIASFGAFPSEVTALTRQTMTTMMTMMTTMMRPSRRRTPMRTTRRMTRTLRRLRRMLRSTRRSMARTLTPTRTRRGYGDARAMSDHLATHTRRPVLLAASAPSFVRLCFRSAFVCTSSVESAAAAHRSDICVPRPPCALCDSLIVSLVVSACRPPRAASLVGALIFIALLSWRSDPAAIHDRLRSTLHRWAGLQDCNADTWSRGRWIPRRSANASDQGEVTTVAEGLAFIGLEGCASTLDLEWAMGLLHEGPLPRRRAMSWTWAPDCALRAFDRPRLLRRLADDGGLLIVGDSTSEQLFLALSCYLYPDVVSVVDEVHVPSDDGLLTAQTDSDDSSRPGGQPRRRWRQHLHLSPSARLDSGTTIDRPLVSFVRTDLLYSRAEIASMLGRPDLVTHEQTIQLYDEPFVRHASMLANASAHYGSVLVSTGGHCTNRAFTIPYSELPDVFSAVLSRWLTDVTALLRSDQRVYIRSYAPGHADCQAALRAAEGPLASPPPVADRYNWRTIPIFNSIARSLVDRAASPSIRYLGLDRPGSMRPDGHGYDCLHLAFGVDTLESQVRFLYHLLTADAMAMA